MTQILKLRGADAFSLSRLARLLDGARVALPGLTGLTGEHWYFTETEGLPGDEELTRLKDLLGVAAVAAPVPKGELLLVTPRLGTISPWSSKATEIARQCGFASIRRIERGTAFHAVAKGKLDRAALAAKLHDRMTECAGFVRRRRCVVPSFRTAAADQHRSHGARAHGAGRG